MHSGKKVLTPIASARHSVGKRSLLPASKEAGTVSFIYLLCARELALGKLISERQFTPDPASLPPAVPG